MKKADIIRKYYDTIRNALIDCYRTVLKCNGRIQYKIYIWEDGEIERLEAPQGDTGWLKPRNCEPRALFYVDLVDAPFFDPWDYTEEPKPEDESERESMEEEINDYLVDSFIQDVDDRLEHIIEDAEELERYLVSEGEYYHGK